MPIIFHGSNGQIPASWTTAGRPSAPDAGQFGYNTTIGILEYWNGTAWIGFYIPPTYPVDYLVVAGGGAGGNGYQGGGGGAGGMLTGSGLSVSFGTSYTITVGAGGTGGASNSVWPVTSGSNSSIAALVVATGGGRGAAERGSPSYANSPAENGGSGGGGSHAGGVTGGTGIAGQGFAGGAGHSSTDNYVGGGGGGAGAVGADATAGTPGAGGNGAASSITGTSVTYAGGGGGSRRGSGGASGGTGGGGSNGGSGTANTGGGGGASQAGGGTSTSGSGGSGIVIIRYASPSQLATGGTVTSYSSSGTTYWVHTFTSSGTFTA